jgi:hypothetical protein
MFIQIRYEQTATAVQLHHIQTVDTSDWSDERFEISIYTGVKIVSRVFKTRVERDAAYNELTDGTNKEKKLWR